MKWCWLLGILCLQVGCASPRTTTSEHAAVFRSAAVAADHELASEAGAAMLRRGGNAVDAAVATSFCLSVVRPGSCGIGGGGFMLISRPGEAPIALNYREVAPSAVGRDYYVALDLDGASRSGVHAPGVPGTVAGLLYALETYGTLDRATVLAPAIRAAEEGFPADDYHVEGAHAMRDAIAERPELASLAGALWTTFNREGNVRRGDLMRNPGQARALRLIAEEGAAGFYDGAISAAIVELMRAHDGPMTADDLRGYRVNVEAPLVADVFGGTMLSMPPPSSGGLAMQQIIGMLERRLGDIPPTSPQDTDYVHVLAECMKHAFADRAEFLADDDFVPVPLDELRDPVYLDNLAARIDLSRTGSKFEYGSAQPAPDDGGTSHFSVIDSNGMAVACTETINLVFGSQVEVPGFGFALNNEMDDFTTIPGQPNAFGLRQSDRNLPEPGKRPLSSMSPTIVLRNGEPILVSGASGGPRIITGTLQSVLNCLLFELHPAISVAAPRLHHQWMPEVLYFEPEYPLQKVRESMERRGHQVDTKPVIGVVQLIQVRPDGIHAVSDPRRGGRPAGM